MNAPSMSAGDHAIPNDTDRRRSDRRAAPVPAAQHRAILDSLGDAALVATDADGDVTDWDDAASRLFGWSAEEMRGVPVDLLYVPEDRAAGRAQVETDGALRGGRDQSEAWHVRKDGSRFWGSCETMPMRDGAGAPGGVLRLIRDQTQHRPASDAQRADAEFLQGVLASSADCIKVLDLDARLAWMSEAGQRIMEVSDFNAVRGYCWPDFWHGADNVAARKAVAAARAGGSGRFQGFAPTFAGAPRWWDVQVTPILGPDGRPERLLSVSRDITAAKQAELRQAALIELGDRLRAVDTPDSIAEAASRIAGETLAVAQTAFAMVSGDGGTATVLRPWRREPGAAPSGSVHLVAEFGSFADALGRGEAVVVNDAAAVAATRARLDGIARYQAAAFVKIPLLEGGRLAGVMLASDDRPRPWTAEEVAFLRSVADRAWAAWKQAEAEARLRALNQTLAEQVEARTQERDRIWQVSQDLLGVTDASGRVLSLNPAWSQALGWPTDWFLGRTIEWVCHPDDVTRSVAERDWLAAGQTTITFENRLRCRDGRYRVLSWTAVPVDGLHYCVGRDVTGDRDRERALRDSRDFTRLALSATGGVGVWTYTVAEDRFRCDAAIAALYGLDQAQAEAGIKREEFLANVHPDDLPRLRATMAGGLVQAGDRELEYRIRHPDGSVRWVLSRGHTYFEGGKPVRRTGVGIELTSQRQLEEQLRQSQKMEAVGQLTGGLAHDFNNLLTAITGSLELLKTRVGQGRLDQIERYVGTAQAAASRAAALTHRLLAFSRRQTLEPKPTDVNRLVTGMEELIRRTAGPEIEVSVRCARELWTALVDPNQLENALLNLCINARDAMPAGGRLLVETSNRVFDGVAAQERELSPGHYLSLRVTDTGTGMAPEVIAKAFEPFFTTKPLGQGTGLGLSMIYGFARQSGGQVRIRSELGRGSAVALYLPRHHGPADLPHEPAGFGEAPRAERGQTVLVVDDEPAIRTLVTEVLEDLGYAAIEAADGASALSVLQSDTRVDLLITDIGLTGGMNGRQVADRARQARPRMPVLFITGYAWSKFDADEDLPPATQVLGKPFSMDALATRVRDVLQQR